MTDNNTPDVPQVVVRQKRGPSIVWLIPLVAAVIGGWLAVKSYLEKGPEVTITFLTADGIEAGKTMIKFKAVDVGVVNTVDISKDLTHVILTASLNPDAEDHLRENTQFWVVRPRIGVSGISGLGTLISGAYLAIRPGEGKPARSFTGLDKPPFVPDEREGLRFILRAEKLGGLGAGVPILYRDIQVGHIEGHRISSDNRGVDIHGFVETPYHSLVRKNTRFYNASGIEVSMDADGFDVKTEGLEALLAGGVAFRIPADEEPGPAASRGDVFKLYESFKSTQDELPDELRLAYVLYFDGSVPGLNVGAPVDLNGIRIGQVESIHMDYDAGANAIRVPVLVRLEPEVIMGISGGSPSQAESIIADLVQKGMRAQLQQGSFITGELFVELGFPPNTPPASVKKNGDHLEIPTIPSAFENLLAKAQALLQKLDDLPLQDLVANASGALNSIDDLVKDLDKDLPTLVKDVDKLANEATVVLKDGDAVVKEARVSLARINTLLDPNSPMAYDTQTALEELATAARSVRILTAYLERHPEAFIRGKAKAER